MTLIKKHKYLVLFLFFLILSIFVLWIRPMVWGPFGFENMDVSNHQVVSESENGEYAIKVYYYPGPTAYFEYTYIGALYKENDFMKNIFWIGPSGNDFEVVWLSDQSILLKNLSGDPQKVELDVLKDSYDFR
ncbi:MULTISPECIES: DUF5412 family protein [Gracilibacillus]|uniref:DUF5412 family protein n=1 Tax=Gracilibacillus TaxID=74385 RepID=UPI000824A549|nr:MULTISPECIES: DUF5412 family protein [Gracilibacillus]